MFSSPIFVGQPRFSPAKRPRSCVRICRYHAVVLDYFAISKASKPSLPSG